MMPQMPRRPLRVPEFPAIHGPGWVACVVLLHVAFGAMGVALFWAGIALSWNPLSMLAFAAAILYCLTVLFFTLGWLFRVRWRVSQPGLCPEPAAVKAPPFEELPWSPR